MPVPPTPRLPADPWALQWAMRLRAAHTFCGRGTDRAPLFTAQVAVRQPVRRSAVLAGAVACAAPAKRCTPRSHALAVHCARLRTRVHFAPHLSHPAMVAP